jgi:ABC-type spermidine/putrescine transport system permease subunit II
MAREDTRWFVVGVVVLSIVLFLALPISVLVVIDYMKIRAEIRYEIRQVKKIKEELKQLKEK